MEKETNNVLVFEEKRVPEIISDNDIYRGKLLFDKQEFEKVFYKIEKVYKLHDQDNDLILVRFSRSLFHPTSIGLLDKNYNPITLSLKTKKTCIWGIKPIGDGIIKIYFMDRSERIVTYQDLLEMYFEEAARLQAKLSDYRTSKTRGEK